MDRRTIVQWVWLTTPSRLLLVTTNTNWMQSIALDSVHKLCSLMYQNL